MNSLQQTNTCKSCQAEITAALRAAVRDAVKMAVELRAVSLANRQSLRNMVQVNQISVLWILIKVDIARMQCCKQ